MSKATGTFDMQQDWNTRVREDWTVIAGIPHEELTPGICLEAVSQNECAILLLPAQFVSYDLWLSAISRNGALLDYVPFIITDNPVQVTELKEAARNATVHDLEACKKVLAAC